MSHKSLKSRRAVSLVELLVVMSASTVILTLSAALIHRMMHTQSKTRSFLDVERTALRLSRQFRHDVHQASAASTEDRELGEDMFLRLQLGDDQTIEYRHHDGKVLRILLQDGKTTAREEFIFPSDIELKFGKEESRRRVVLSITDNVKDMRADDAKPPLQAYATPVSFRAEAYLSRAARFIDRKTDEEKPE